MHQHKAVGFVSVSVSLRGFALRFKNNQKAHAGECKSLLCLVIIYNCQRQKEKIISAISWLLGHATRKIQFLHAYFSTLTPRRQQGSFVTKVIRDGWHAGAGLDDRLWLDAALLRWFKETLSHWLPISATKVKTNGNLPSRRRPRQSKLGPASL